MIYFILFQVKRLRPEPNFAFLQCTSCYPTKFENLNLNVIEEYRKRFPDIVIGYSGHEKGFIPTVGAVAKGAKIVERHLTLHNGNNILDVLRSYIIKNKI